MTERVKRPRKGDFEVMQERKLLEGISWKDWRPTLAGFLEEKGFEMPQGEAEEILHKVFIARRLYRIGVITSDDMLEKMHSATNNHDELIDNSPAILLSMKYITEKIGSSL
jgi:hypothetical protein